MVFLTEYNGTLPVVSDASYSLGRERQTFPPTFSSIGKQMWLQQSIIINLTPVFLGSYSPGLMGDWRYIQRKPTRYFHREPKRAKSWCRYYTNSSASRRLLLRGGDISSNPGPVKANKPKCAKCERTIARNHRNVQCKDCENRTHIKCAGLAVRKHQQAVPVWSCSKCVLDLLPFSASHWPDSDADVRDTEPEPVVELLMDLEDNIQLESLRKRCGKEILICHLNINSIQNKYEELTDLIRRLKVHVMLVSETKIDASYTNNRFAIPGFSVHRKDRKKGGGGVMAIVSSSLESKRISIKKSYKTLEPIAVEVKTKVGNVIILCIYRPPKNLCGDYQINLENELSDICNWASLQSSSVIVAGDLNLDRLRSDKAEGKLLLDLEAEQDFQCLITKPTRIEMRDNRITKTLIDVLLSNKPELFRHSGNYYPSLSDHALIYGILKERVNSNKPKVITFRSYKNFNPEEFRKQLAAAPWHVGDIFDDIDDQANVHNTLINNILDESAPHKRMRVRERDVPYMTAEWKQAIRAKRKATSKFLKNQTSENWELKRKARNEATRQRRIAIKNYWQEKADHLKDKPRDFFRTFRPFLSTKECSRGSDIHLKENGAVVKDQAKVTEILADYFASIADGIGGHDAELMSMEDFKDHESVQRIRDSGNILAEGFEVEPVTQGQVLKALETLKTEKAAGRDGIPPKIIKLGAKELQRPLTNLYNACINSGVWPKAWKSGDWAPVYKKDDRYCKENYRPVTVLNCIGKILEKLIESQASASFRSIFYENSSAYRKNYSCETTLINLIESWRRARDEGSSVSILSTDMSKAFDSLHPPLLLSKLKAYGFGDNAIKLFDSYLRERENRVKIGSYVSTARLVNRGCPQGSALGPVLWNIFQNDLAYHTNSHLSMYADDHQMFHMGKDSSVVISNLRESAETATKWYDSNLLMGNLEKYQTMNIGRCTVDTLSIKGKDIKTTEELKLLGVTIDSKMDFSNHISTLCKKASQKIGVLMRLRNLIPTMAKLQLFKAAILPHLTYCHLAWHFCRASDARKLERLQERGLRAVFKDKNSSYHQLLERAKLPTLLNRRLQDVCILMYKVKYKLSPPNICSIFKEHTSQYNLRQSDFSVPRFNTVTYGKHSLRYLGPKVWGKLSSRERALKSLPSFKRMIRKKNIALLLEDGCKNCTLCNS